MSVTSLTSVSAQGVASDLLGRINGLRGELSLAPYTLNSALTAAAQSHAQWMADTSQVTHVQPNGSTPSTRAQANGYQSSWVAENIYMGLNATADTAWTFWVNSSIHYAGLTSSNFREIGIASATGEGGRAYVLVFGNPGGRVPQTTTSNNGGGNSSAANAAPAAPPVAIVGYDDVGNIQYELQAGETLGDVLLLFGYTWDDLYTLLDLNGFTDADIRTLSVGQVILVPPPQGTYTPTPLVTEPEATPEVESTSPAEATDEVVEPITDEIIPTPNPSGILPTLDTVYGVAGFDFVTETPTATASPTALPTRTNEPTAIATQIAQVASATAIIAETATPIPTLAVNNSVQDATSTPLVIAEVSTDVPTPMLVTTDAPVSSSRNLPPLWLIGAIVSQVGVLIFASVQFIRNKQ
ncbi:MAG: CAP domain-containing protein [Chloroflexota bacterium]